MIFSTSGNLRILLNFLLFFYRRDWSSRSRDLSSGGKDRSHPREASATVEFRLEQVFVALLGLPYVPNFGNPRRRASKICENHQRRSRSFWLHHTRLRLNQYLRCTSRNPGSRGPARSTCKEPPSSPSQLVPYSDEAVRWRRVETACSFLRLPFNNSI